MRHALGERATDVGGKSPLIHSSSSYDDSAPQASKEFKVESSLARYWALKTTDPEFHPGNWGGSQNEDAQHRHHLCRVLIWALLQENNQPSLRELSVFLGSCGLAYSKSSISLMLKEWRWSFKIPSVIQASKYTPTNVTYYNQYCAWFRNTDIHKLKFIDEVHFDPRGKPF